MFNGKHGDILTAILITVIILILGLVGWFAYDIYVKNSIDNNAKSALDEFNKTIKNKVKDTEKDGDTDLDVGKVISTDKNVGKTKAYLAGYEIKGSLKIPRTGVEYPILSEVSKKSLEAAVAILYGPGLNQVGNTTILGHNYRNNSFFSNNDKLTEGDIIEITDQTGTTLKYEIYKMYETTVEDAEYMLRDTEGRREISLSTCTDDSSARLVIWAKEKE